MYFSFCHDLYHILNGNPDYINEKREVHFNQDYLSNEKENKANLFAANLLMPEMEFEKLYSLYRKDDNSIEEIVVKLMNYFNSPFVAVLLRIYELQILEDLKEVEELLKYDNDKIESLFDDLWIDKEILEPAMKDEMPNLLNLLEKEGTELIQKQLLSEYDFNNIIENIRSLYSQISLQDD